MSLWGIGQEFEKINQFMVYSQFLVVCLSIASVTQWIFFDVEQAGGQVARWK